MRKIIMILVMAMVAFGSFAKSFKYEADNDRWTYDEDRRELYYNYKLCDIDYAIFTYDVSEGDAWKIINGEEFPTFEFIREEDDEYVSVCRMPARDYSNRSK